MKKLLFIMAFTFFNFILFSEPSQEIPAIDFNQYLNFKPMYTWSNIRIWGWSRDSKIAYSNDKYIDGRGGVITTVAIFDLINDVIIWEKMLDSFNYEEEENEIIYSDAYNNFIIDFRKTCEQNRIEFMQTKFLNLPIRFNKQTVNIIIESNKKSDVREEWESDFYGDIGNYKTIAENQGIKKIIHEKTFSTAAVDVVVCGYFISPFEDRALIVIGEYVRVFEGWDIEYVFIGCHLSVGFR